MLFARPQPFLDLCERLKGTRPDFEAVKGQILDFRRTIRRHTQGLIFEYLVGNTIISLAKDYGARQLQPQDADLFEPYVLKPLRYGCTLNWAYSGNTIFECDVALRAGNCCSQIWVFEAKAGKESLLINPAFAKAIRDLRLQFSFANVTLQEKYERRVKRIKKRLDERGIVITYLPVTEQELNALVADLPLGKTKLSPAKAYLGDFYKPKN